MVFISNNYDIPDYFNCRCDTRIDDSQGILDDDHVDVAGVLPDVVHNFCHDVGGIGEGG